MEKIKASIGNVLLLSNVDSLVCQQFAYKQSCNQYIKTGEEEEEEDDG
jgi:hypothetical protein